MNYKGFLRRVGGGTLVQPLQLLEEYELLQELIWRDRAY